jgi:hypothetical protein
MKPSISALDELQKQDESFVQDSKEIAGRISPVQ